jgi:hypothetical protein
MVFSFFAEPPTVAGADNAILYSNAFDNALWTLDKALLESGQADPDAGSGGWRLKDDNLGGTGYITNEQQIFSLPAGTYTFSCHVRGENGNNALLRIGNTGDVSMDGHQIYDLYNQTVKTAGAAPGHTNVRVVSSTNGFVRIATTFVTTTTRNVIFKVGIADSSLQNWLTANGTYSILISRAQVSAGNQLLPYSETTDTPVT